MKLGIDFGTCYSSAALFIDGKLSPVKEPSKPLEYCFPSSVCMTKKGEIVISQAAENQRRLNPQGYKNQFKRDLETGIPYLLGEKSLFPEDLVEIMIRGLKKEAEKIVNSSLDSVVITVPASYLSSKKQLMEVAARKAGFTEVTLLAEPVAAAIYYAEAGKVGHQLNEGEIILVYDLGGGTFDAALIQKKGRSYELLGQPEGDKECGGIDFDFLIGEDFKQQLDGDPALELLSRKRMDSDALRAKLSFQDWCRNFKHQLSMVEEYEDLSPVGSDSYSLSRDQFELMIAKYIDSSCNLCQRLVDKVGIKWERINRILLVGGSCRIPYVQKRLEQQFRREVVAIDDPELAICYGAAIYGVNLVKDREGQQKNPNRKESPNDARHDSTYDREETIHLSMLEAFQGVVKSLNVGNENIKIRIPSGAKPGSRIFVRGKGNISPLNQQRGNLYMTTIIDMQKFFQFEQDNLVYELSLSPEAAEFGTLIEVPTPDGLVTLTVPPGVKSGQSLRLRGKGWYSANGERGDQLVKIQISTPIKENLTLTIYGKISAAFGVTKESLGIETLGGVMTIIIPKNTSIPTRKPETFTTAIDRQTNVEISVFKGNGEMTKDNVSLGLFRLDGISPAPQGVPQIEVIFDIDVQGFLSIFAKDKATGNEMSLICSMNMF